MFRAIAFTLAILATAPAWAAECVQVTLKDVNNLPVKTSAPIVGFLLPESAPLIDFNVAPGTQIIPGPPVPCPAALVKGMQDVFDSFCLTDEQRQAAAQANNATLDNIKKRCGEIYAALNSKK